MLSNISAKDADAGINALVEYRIVSGPDADGVFAFQSPHQPILTLRKALDYERTQRYVVAVVASVRSRSLAYFMLVNALIYLLTLVICIRRAIN